MQFLDFSLLGHMGNGMVLCEASEMVCDRWVKEQQQQNHSAHLSERLSGSHSNHLHDVIVHFDDWLFGEKKKTITATATTKPRKPMDILFVHFQHRASHDYFHIKFARNSQ